MIAETLGFAFQGTSHTEPKEQLFSYLKDKQMLLLTDNLEQLLAEPGIEVLAELLAGAPQVKLLATSREALGLQGEWVFEVPGLPVPGGREAQEQGQDTSVDLFVQSARRANVGFQATAEDHPTIVSICQLVEGMPLESNWRLHGHAPCHARGRGGARTWPGFFEHLRPGPASPPSLHAGRLRALLGAPGAGRTAGTAAALAVPGRVPASGGRGRGRGQSGRPLPAGGQIPGAPQGRKSPEGYGRYDLHEMIRQFTAEQFAQHPEEQAAALAVHGRYYLAYFSQADARLRSPAQRETLAELTAEADNFQAAWEWASAHGEFALIEQALGAGGLSTTRVVGGRKGSSCWTHPPGT